MGAYVLPAEGRHIAAPCIVHHLPRQGQARLWL
jgi:hypothetical protein